MKTPFRVVLKSGAVWQIGREWPNPGQGASSVPAKIEVMYQVFAVTDDNGETTEPGVEVFGTPNDGSTWHQTGKVPGALLPMSEIRHIEYWEDPSYMATYVRLRELQAQAQKADVIATLQAILAPPDAAAGEAETTGPETSAPNADASAH